jgi:UDP-N-acetylglucosamine/UDP-N-acetylgalactosamine diphosphorylase
MITEKYKKALDVLTKHNQQHLLKFWDELDDSSKKNLLGQIEQIDFNSLDSKINEYVKNAAPTKLPSKIEPAPVYTAEPKTPAEKEKFDKAKKLGAELMSQGKVAAFVVAGGQGTRLGFDGPKGDFKVSPIKNKSLFQIFAESIKAAGAKYKFSPKWYIMTSPLNYEPTRKIFKDNDFFGLGEQGVYFFVQGTEVNYSMDGQILLADKGVIAESPDGHGGSLKAIYKSGAVADMQKLGIEYISYFQVDNPLINIFDPLFIGLHAMDEAEMSSKYLTKCGPLEKVGNFCLADGKVTVIEYSDLPDELAYKKNPDGSLVFSLGSIAIHIISRKFIERLNAHGFALPYHRAVKKIPYVDIQTGKKIEPQKTNGIKLETFVFDALPLAKGSIILETIRSEEFAPVKNAEGADSPAVTKRMITERGAKWLEAAGVQVPKKADGSIDCVIEIAPSYALSAEDVIAKKPNMKITAGQNLYLD